MNNIKILGIAGSLRKDSYNKALLRAAKEEAPKNMEIKIFDLAEIPLFNEDVEAQGDPEPVKKLKHAIAKADAFLFTIPEYNHGLPGVLKNTLDWISRPHGESYLIGKVCGIMGASPSSVGTARSHEQLYNFLVYSQCQIVASPQVLVANAHEKFEDGKLIDHNTRDFARKHLEAIEEKARSLSTSNFDFTEIFF